MSTHLEIKYTLGKDLIIVIKYSRKKSSSFGTLNNLKQLIQPRKATSSGQ